MLELAEDFGQHVQASGFVGADGQQPARRGGLIGHGAQRFLAQGQELIGVFKEHFAGGSQADGLAQAAEKLLAVFLFQLADLRAHGGLRAKDLAPGQREAAVLGHFDEGIELVEIHDAGTAF